ncbi:hypothetical protein GP2_003_00070 [Gordonia paraffinivorans NBRC 108238]|uniref:Transposase n=1 Tax=Gordonia paraffinivorans NBRC 108238 TaxID=1223543 RepID=A0ABQ0IG08_9ACTN|nr:hypothetical protein GP2_003_00070 [Gordonia paraffinivorans NBRC 108238]
MDRRPFRGESKKPRVRRTRTNQRQFDLRPILEAASHRTRRARYTWQVFGLAVVARQEHSY